MNTSREKATEMMSDRTRGFQMIKTFVNTLTVKMLVAFLIVALVPLGIVVYLNDRAARKALTAAGYQSLFAAVSQTAVSLDAFIDSNLDVIGTEAQIPALSAYLSLSPEGRSQEPAKKQILEILHNYSGKNRVFISSYALLDLRGLNVIDTDPSGTGMDLSERDYFKKALETGLPYVSPVRFYEADGNAYLYFSSPVYKANSEPVGVLCARYSASLLQQLIVGNSGLIGPQSFAILANESHLLLAYGLLSHGSASDLLYKTVKPLSPERISELQQAGLIPKQPLDQILADLPDLAKGLAKVDSREPYFTSRLMATGDILAGAVLRMHTQPWLVAFFQPQSVFMKPVHTQTAKTLFVTIIIAGVIGALAIIAAQLISKPITRLSDMAMQVAGGDLNVPVPEVSRVLSSHEIVVLTRTFSQMLKSIRQSEEALRKSEEKYHGIFKTAAVSIWEEDFTAVKAAIDDLKSQGVTDFQKYLDEHPEFVIQVSKMVKVVDINEATIRMFGAASKEEMLGSLDKVFVPESLPTFREQIVAIAKGQTYFESEGINQTLQGERLNILMTITIPFEAKKFNSVLVSIMDITALKRAEDEIRTQSKFLRFFSRLVVESLIDFQRKVAQIMESIGFSFDNFNLIIHPFQFSIMDGIFTMI